MNSAKLAKFDCPLSGYFLLFLWFAYLRGDLRTASFLHHLPCGGVSGVHISISALATCHSMCDQYATFLVSIP